jgi:reactive intermediate/imine deaminase
MIEYITDSDSPSPAGHYSQATRFDGQLFISGQLPIDHSAADACQAMKATFGEQAERALSNMLNILTGSGGSTGHLAKVTAYIVGVENWGMFDRVYARILGPVRPARAIVPVPELHYGYLVEVDAIAIGLDRDRDSLERLDLTPAS